VNLSSRPAPNLAEPGPARELWRPSAAAAVVNGRPANGTIEWKLQTTGQTYKEWEVEKLNQEG